jgi:hypothetical protein
MAIMKITGQGLAAIALSVAALWGCFLGEQLTLRQARQERARVIRDIRRLQRRAQQPQPAATPSPSTPRPQRAILG